MRGWGGCDLFASDLQAWCVPAWTYRPPSQLGLGLKHAGACSGEHSRGSKVR